MKNWFPSIFIVDDNLPFSRLTETFLRKKGFKNIKSFFSGEECLLNLIHKPDIILLDYNLNEGKRKSQNGLQVAARIKKRLPDARIILISGEMNYNVEKFCDTRFINCIDRYLVKGMNNNNELLEAINEFVY